MQLSLAVFLVVAAAVLGAVVGGLTLPRLHRRREREAARRDGATLQEVLESVYRQAPYALAVVDRHHDVILYNDKAEALRVVQERQLVEPVWHAAQQTFTRGGATVFHLAPQVLSARHHIPSVSGRAVILDGHDRQFVVVFAADDSEHRRMEAARRDFVANVSHELKTPVGAMAVLAEALLEAKDDPDSVEYFGTRVVTEAHRLGNMVSELIALSRLQGAEKIRDPEPVAVDDVVAEAVSRTASAAENAGITVACDEPGGLTVLGDRTLLVTAVTNLLTNAINYSPEGSPVSISRDADDESVFLRVTDRGIGIAPEHQGRVFERFFRVDKARSRATGGTGLGLAIVKHVVNNHNGVVRLWSAPGTGSTFTLELPAHHGPDTDDDRLPADDADPGRAARSLRREDSES